MLRRSMIVLLVSALALGPWAQPVRAQASGGLADRLDSLIARLAPPEAQVGVSVVALPSGQVLYSHQADKAFTPASLNKLLTSSAALTLLGAQHRFFTRLMTPATVEGGRLRGDLFLRGEGDPVLEPADLDALASALHTQGLHEITGDLVADATLFKPEGPGGAGWAWDDLPWAYGAPVSALTLHKGAIDLALSPGAKAGDPLGVGIVPTTGYVQLRVQARTSKSDSDDTLAITPLNAGTGREIWKITGHLPVGTGTEVLNRSIADPARYTATSLREALERHGIKLDGQIRLGQTPAGARTIAAHQSPPLADLVHEMNKESENLVAETLLFQLGLRGEGAPATWQKGLHTLKGFLSRVGWPEDHYRLADGSGMSRYDAYSPALLTRLLSYMPSQPLAYPALLISLPVAGIDGTLAGRLQDPAVRGRLRAKTGTMSLVSGLAGYLQTPDGQTLALAVMVNGYLGAPAQARAVQDAIVQALAQPSATH